MLRVLDTTVLIDYLRGRPAVARVRDLLDAGDDVATTAINVEEIICGLGRDEGAAANSLFNGLHILTIDRAIGDLAGGWRRDFARTGTTLSQADCLIAAGAARHSATLITGNPRHFPMPGLDLLHWPVGT